MALYLKKESFEWALEHLLLEGDTDLLPAPFEFEVIKQNWGSLLPELLKLDLRQYRWNPVRKYLVPKDQLAFRLASQLEPIDALIFAALIKEAGQNIHDYRKRHSAGIAYSYWFNPQPNGLFFGSTTSWHDFWRTSQQKGGMPWSRGTVAVADISDFYNQIYHHVAENQLDECLGEDYALPIKLFLKNFDNKVSRGVPVGPHAAHVLAELSLVPFDQAYASRGFSFIRYVDDIHIFCDSVDAAQVAVFALAESLDKQQKLVLNKQKTKIYSSEEHRQIAAQMLVDQPLNSFEENLLNLIKKYSGNDPYRFTAVTDLDESDLKSIDREALEDLLRLYLEKEERPYPRLGWLLRRLSQIGVPHAMDFVVDNFSSLVPIIGVASRYMLRARAGYDGDMLALGDKLTELLALPLVQNSEYLQVVILSLFYEMPELNHFPKIGSKYGVSSDSVRRGILLAAASAKNGSWLRERKDDLFSCSSMTRRSLLFAAGALPGDESHIWLKGTWGRLTGLEQACYLAGAKGKTDLKITSKFL